MSRDVPGWWETVSPHLDTALDLTVEDRAVWLTALRDRDPATAAQVAALLDEHAAACDEGFLDGTAPCPAGLRATAGTVVGGYTLIAPIGEGGMGVVWLAERADAELHQRVAIKVLGLPGRRPAWRQRFLRERRLLASLHHPAIVQAIDAGHTGDGAPYLVMEYVDGTPIDVYAHRRPLADRLHLFLRVCDGVAYAHRRLVIHRDLKPSNILVDAAGQPKLLDFGIAKLLDESGDPTLTIERVLTPRYASPEQLQGSVQTTATDIYSLGAVLYHMATGRSPHDADGRATSAAASTGRVRSLSRARVLSPDLPVDLDYILRKALRPEPDERYASVDAFANDVRALLESRPVEARSGDAWYRTRTFLRRYPVGVTATLVAFGSLAGGLYAANRQRRVAQQRFREVRQLANAFIGLDVPLRDLPGSTAVRSRIVTESLEYLERLGGELRDDPDLSLEIGDAYRRVGEVQGVPFVANLGLYAQSEESLRKADALVDGTLAAEPSNRNAWLVSAQIHRDWMALADYQNRRAETLAHAAAATARLDRFLRLGAPSPDEVDTATLVYAHVATAYENSHRYEEAVAYCRRALAISDGVPAAQMRRASAFGVLSVALREGLGDLDAALAAASNSREILERIAVTGGRTELYNLHLAYLREADVLGDATGLSLNRTAEAAAAYQHAIDITRTLVQRDPNDSASRIAVVIASRSLGELVRPTDPRAALAIYDEALATLHEAAPNRRSRFEEVQLLASASYASRALGHQEDARRRIAAAFTLLRDLDAYPTEAIDPGREVYETVKALADHHAAIGHAAKAIEVYSDLLQRLEASGPDPEHNLVDALVMSTTRDTLAGLLRAAGRS